MIAQLKENAFLSFTLSLVASYFACLGYYSFFHIDITTFLSIEDITLIFAKYIWLTAVFIVMSVYIFYSFAKKMDNSNSWWDETIRGTFIKRRAFVIIPLVFVVIVAAFLYKLVADFLSALAGGGAAIVVVLISAAVLYSSFKRKSNITEFTFKNWLSLVAAFYFFFFIIPFVGGMIAASKSSSEHVLVEFDDNKLLNTADSLNQIYIGKTSDYFFVINTQKKETTAFRMDKVKSLQIVRSKQKQY